MTANGEAVEEKPAPEAKEEKPTETGEPGVASEDPNVLTLVIQFNKETKQCRVILPKAVEDMCTLYGMLEMAREFLIRGQLTRDITKSVTQAFMERLAIKGRGGIKIQLPGAGPTKEQIDAAAKKSNGG